MANDPNGLANEKYALDQIQGYNANTSVSNPAGWSGFAFSPTAGWKQNSDGSLSLLNSVTQPQTTDPSVAQPIPSNYNFNTGLFTGGSNNSNTSANVANGVLGGGTQTSTPLDSNLAAALRQLMQQSQDQSTQGQNLLKGLLDQLQGNINFNQQQTTRTSGQRDSLVAALLGGNFNDQGAFTANDSGLLGGYKQLLGTINQGLDPQTLASLNQQAIEGPQRDYQSQVGALKTALAGRGAYGGGDTPGDFSAILGGYAPLMTARDTTREGLLQNVSFENQTQKNANNAQALNALSGLGNLTSNLASTYNPASFNNATTNALQNALSGVGQNTATGFQGLNTAGNLASILNDTSTGSLASLLKASLLGTGLNTLTTKTSNGNSILGSLIGLIPGLGGGSPRNVDADWEAINNWAAQNNLPQLDPSLKNLLMQDPGGPL